MEEKLKCRITALGRKGQRRMGKTDNYDGPDKKGFIGGQADVQRSLVKDGFQLCADFPLNCKETKTVTFALGQRKKDICTWKVFKLAKPSKDSKDKDCLNVLNPFMHGMPFGEKHPLPR